jgi:predicted DCC family thiol-disulfide oxidoreductase YuxK
VEEAGHGIEVRAMAFHPSGSWELPRGAIMEAVMINGMVSSVRNEDRWVIYYDGDCGFCYRVKRWLSTIDFFDRIEWTPYRALERPPRGLSWDDLDRAAYLDTGQGPLSGGVYAFRMLALRLLPLIPLVPILWCPGMNLVGEVAYGWVARNRYRLSGCRRVSE